MFGARKNFKNVVGIMIYSLVGYWKYITVRWKMYGEDNFY